MKAACTEDVRLTRGIGVTPIYLRVHKLLQFLDRPKINFHIEISMDYDRYFFEFSLIQLLVLIFSYYSPIPS
jgi:hypothetical protein